MTLGTISTLSPELLDEKSSIPLYQQIYELLREQILDGTFKLYERLPAEKELIDTLGVSRITVKRGMNELAKAGLVRRHRGSGTVVIYDADASIIRGSFDTMIDGLTRMVVTTKVRLLDCTMSEASPAIAKELGISAQDKVQRIVRVRSLDDAPLSYLVTYIPCDIADRYDPELLTSESLISLLESAGHAPVEAEQVISAVHAEGAVAANLGVAPGSPILRIHRLMKDARGRVVQVIMAHYRPERFEYHMMFTRNEPGQADWTSQS